MLRLHHSVMWPVHGTGLISATARGFLFQGGRTESEDNDHHTPLPPLSSPPHRPCLRGVYRAKRRVCNIRSPRDITRASPATLRCVRCKPRTRRRTIRELSVTRLAHPMLKTEISKRPDKLVVEAEAAGVACEASCCAIRRSPSCDRSWALFQTSRDIQRESGMRHQDGRQPTTPILRSRARRYPGIQACGVTGSHIAPSDLNPTRALIKDGALVSALLAITVAAGGLVDLTKHRCFQSTGEA